jgi:hypothetical protein
VTIKSVVVRALYALYHGTLYLRFWHGHAKR